MAANDFQAEAEKLRGNLSQPDEPAAVTGTTMFQNVAAKLRSTITGSDPTPATDVAEDWHDLETPPAIHIPNYENDTAKLRNAHASSMAASADYTDAAKKLRDTHTSAGDVDMTTRGSLFGETGTLIDYRNNAPFHPVSSLHPADSHVLDEKADVKAALPESDLAVKDPLPTSSTKHTHFEHSPQPSSAALASVSSHDACAICVQRHNSEHHARHSVDMQDAAATAALYVSRSTPPVGRTLKETYITSDNKLSSAG